MAKKSKNVNLLKKGSPDITIIIVTAILVALGLIMVLSASSPSSLSESGDSYKYFKKQLIATIGGVVVLYFLYKIDYNVWRKLKWIIYAGAVGLLFLVGVMGLSAGGATRWINIAGFNFQPSEVSKVAFILFFAAVLTDLKENKLINTYKGFWIPIGYLILPVIAIFVVQNHFSATLIIAGITVIQMFVAGVSLKWFLLVGLAGIGAIAGLMFGTSFRSEQCTDTVELESIVCAVRIVGNKEFAATVFPYRAIFFERYSPQVQSSYVIHDDKVGPASRNSE